MIAPRLAFSPKLCAALLESSFSASVAIFANELLARSEAASYCWRARIPITMSEFTELQGQYLAFIYYYTKLNRRPPAEADMQYYFRVTPPSVHQMVVTLEKKGFISRRPGQARSIEILVDAADIPDLN
jgi:repressor LexA